MLHANALQKVMNGVACMVSRTGAGSVPAFYEFDAAGKMTKLIDGEANQTAFFYDCCNLTGKQYADGTGYDYAYNARNWLELRTDPKGAITEYGYNNVGQLTNVNYARSAE